MLYTQEKGKENKQRMNGAVHISPISVPGIGGRLPDLIRKNNAPVFLDVMLVHCSGTGVDREKVNWEKHSVSQIIVKVICFWSSLIRKKKNVVHLNGCVEFTDHIGIDAGWLNGHILERLFMGAAEHIGLKERPPANFGELLFEKATP